jgi:hypothetical protein
MFTIPTANELVTFIKDFTGSTNDAEIKKCIFMAEMSMRNIELPALRCDPYAPENIGVADANGRIPIPGDMNKPILFFKQGQQYLTTGQATGVQGQDTITMITTPNKSLSVGMSVTGTGIAEGATIVSFPSPNYSVVQLSLPNTGTVSGVVIFQTATPGSPSSQTGPWIVYDRIGDRDIITQSMIAQLYLQPVNVPAVIRGKFSEVGQYYEFLPYVSGGDLINMYYYKAWPLLFSPADDQLLSLTGTVSSISGSGPWTATLSDLVDSSVFTIGMDITALAGKSGTLGATGTVSDITGSGPWTGTISGLTDTTDYLVGSTITATNGLATLISSGGTLYPTAGSGPWVCTIQGMDSGSTALLTAGDYITSASGIFNGGSCVVDSIIDGTQISVTITGGTGPTFYSPTGQIDKLGGSLGTSGTYVISDVVNSTTIEFTATGGSTPIAGGITNVVASAGSLGTGGTYVVESIVNSTTITFSSTGGTTPLNGPLTLVSETNITVQNNAVLSTWPEGYVYATLREYYIKRHNAQDATVYDSKFKEAWNVIEDQNNLGKWSGGHTRLTSVWQPRQYRQYNIK